MSELPPEVEEALTLIGDYAEANPAEEEVDVYNAQDTIRAHITAQAAEIERLRVNCAMDCDSCEHRIPPEECYVLVINAQNVADRDRYKAALTEIAKAEGAFSRDPLAHATNVINSMVTLAEEATRDE